MSILFIGQCVYDVTFPVEGEIIENQKYRIYNKRECMGGPAGNASYLGGLWGAKSTLVTRLGDDLFSREIIKTLQSVNVKTDFININPDTQTSLSFIIVNEKNGHRTILNAPLISSIDTLKLPDKKPNVILTDGREVETSLLALKMFPEAVSLIDAGTYRKELEPLISEVDYLVCSEDFARQYTGLSVLENKVEVFDKLINLNPNVIVTIGDKGSLYYEDSDIVHVDAFKAEVVDTTGAGDIFHGAFAYCLNQNIPLYETIEISSLVAAISVERLGGQTSIPTLEEVIERAKKVAPHLVELLSKS